MPLKAATASVDVSRMRTHFDFIGHLIDYLNAAGLDPADERWLPLRDTAARVAADMTAIVAEHEEATPLVLPASAREQFADRFVTAVLEQDLVTDHEAVEMRAVFAQLAPNM